MPFIIDFHTHAFPDALAPRAIASLAATAAACGYVPHTDGTVRELLSSMQTAGITESVVCNVATNVRQMPKVNDFAISTLHEPRLIPFGSLHPAATPRELESELDRLIRAGIRGIKIHPDYVGVEIDAPAFDPILSLCEARAVPVITHAGFDPLSPEHVHATPAMLRRVLDRYPRLTLIAAHTGGFDEEDATLETLVGTRIYLDTSLSAIRLGKDPAWGDKCAAIIRNHDPHRLLFGTDSPWSTPQEELAFLNRIGLSEDRLRAILSENATRLLAAAGTKEPLN